MLLIRCVVDSVGDFVVVVEPATSPEQFDLIRVLLPLRLLPIVELNRLIWSYVVGGCLGVGGECGQKRGRKRGGRFGHQRVDKASRLFLLCYDNDVNLGLDTQCTVILTTSFCVFVSLSLLPVLQYRNLDKLSITHTDLARCLSSSFHGTSLLIYTSMMDERSPIPLSVYHLAS